MNNTEILKLSIKEVNLKIKETIEKLENNRCRILIDHDHYFIDRKNFTYKDLSFSVYRTKDTTSYGTFLNPRNFLKAKYISIGGYLYKFDKRFFLQYIENYYDAIITAEKILQNIKFQGDHDLIYYNKKDILKSMSSEQLKKIYYNKFKITVNVKAQKDNGDALLIYNGGNFKNIEVNLSKETRYELLKDLPGFSKGTIFKEEEYKKLINIEEKYKDEYIKEIVIY